MNSQSGKKNWISLVAEAWESEPWVPLWESLSGSPNLGGVLFRYQDLLLNFIKIKKFNLLFYYILKIPSWGKGFYFVIRVLESGGRDFILKTQGIFLKLWNQLRIRLFRN